MAKVFAALLLGFMFAPSFMHAENVLTQQIVGNPCLVKVYHTNFVFPPEGGRVVQVGNDMYFWKSYLPECATALPSNTPVMVTTATGVAKDPYNLGGAYGQQIVGNPCAIRVYHTNFMLPAQGGKIVQAGSDLYFIKTYQAGCENAGATLPVIKQGNVTSTVVPTVTPVVSTYVAPTTTTVVPTTSYTATTTAPTYTLAGSGLNSNYNSTNTVNTATTTCVQN